MLVMPSDTDRYRFRRMDSALLRAATQPGEPTLPLWPTPEESAKAGPDRWVAWLRQTWTDERIADSVEVASPALAARIEAVVGGAVIDARRARRMALALARYVLRARSRAIPYGLFAGVVPAEFGAVPDVRFGQRHRGRLRPSAEWLDIVISRFEHDLALLPRLPVVANTLCRVVGDRLRVPVRGADDTGSREVSLRLTPAVAFVMDVAVSPVPFGDLAAKLAAKFQGASLEEIDALLGELVTRQVLITGLRPPATRPDPLEYLLDQLYALGADTLPHLACQIRMLTEIHSSMAKLSNVQIFSGESRSSRASVMESMRELAPAGDAPLVVDVRMDGRIVLPDTVGHDVERAAEVLARLAAYRQGTPAWREYAERFARRYGPGALVPVTELVDPVLGMGYPAGYPTSAPATPPTLTVRDERLLALAQRAALDGATEVILTDTMITELRTSEEEAHSRLPPHLELNVQVYAESLDALAKGTFTVRVLGVSRAAGTMTGRFLPLLEPTDKAGLVAALTRLPTVTDQATALQLSFAPLHVRADHVVRAPRLSPSVISLGEHPDPAADQVPLKDVAVGCTADRRLFLASMSRECVIETLAPTSLNYRSAAHTPPLARFLAELSRSSTTQVTGFDWGAAGGLPFLPALRYGRIVLSPARWRLSHADLPGAQAPFAEWIDALHAWRERRHVPTQVLLAEGDQHLLLALDQHGPAELLRDHLNRAGRATLIQGPEPSDLGWCGGRAHSLVVPLISTQPSAPSPHVGASTVIRLRDEGSMPGARPRLDAELSVAADVQTQALLRIPDLMKSLSPITVWWFDRHGDREAVLHLHIVLPGETGFGEAAEALGSWAGALRAQGLLRELRLAGHTLQAGQWRTSEVLAAAERVFHTDSRVVLSQLTMPHGFDAAVVGAANLVALATGFLGGPDQAMRWLTDRPRLRPAPSPVPRRVHADAVHLANPAEGFAALHLGLGSTAADREAWQERAQALDTCRYMARQDERNDLDAMLAALFDAHARRAFGADDVQRHLSLHLARAAALAYLHAKGAA
ncbi:lantibiotic dehydratase [Spongiactinospora rosea]|uniref:Lantibiotic dehydratase n=2 Tax=Spongiactinospora rosea TaxID=2248750 RepID=A0A366LPL6_9ACTN|nr:lantibiotic dehydratase [Spongiactinospora rosea]